MLWMMERPAKKKSNTAKFQLWQAESHPIELSTKSSPSKIDYIHNNTVEAGFVARVEDWKYSSAIDIMG